MSENRLTRQELKVRNIAAIILVFFGFATILIGLYSWNAGAHSPLNLTVTIILGVLMLVAGVLMFITEMFESWLSHSQAALVDGLQAG